MTRLLGILAIVVVIGVALLAGFEIQRWREREEETRLRAIHTLTGRVKAYPPIPSEALGGARGVWVYLPPQYEREPARRFPVLYMHDGQNVFDGATAFIAGQEWQADETAERLVAEGRIEPLIIVAADNGGERRLYEYTPTADPRGPSGGADAYRRFLVEDLKPWVDLTFRTRPGREDTGIAGSSLGGLVSLWVGLKEPGVFGKIAAVSVSVWWDRRTIVRFVDSLPSKPDTRLWVDIGTREGDEAVPDARLLRDALLRKGWRQGVDLAYVEAEGAVHNEAAWAKRVPAILEFLYPPPGAAPQR